MLLISMYYYITDTIQKKRKVSKRSLIKNHEMFKGITQTHQSFSPLLFSPTSISIFCLVYNLYGKKYTHSSVLDAVSYLLAT